MVIFESGFERCWWAIKGNAPGGERGGEEAADETDEENDEFKKLCCFWCCGCCFLAVLTFGDFPSREEALNRVLVLVLLTVDVVEISELCDSSVSSECVDSIEFRPLLGPLRWWGSSSDENLNLLGVELLDDASGDDWDDLAVFVVVLLVVGVAVDRCCSLSDRFWGITRCFVVDVVVVTCFCTDCFWCWCWLWTSSEILFNHKLGINYQYLEI